MHIQKHQCSIEPNTIAKYARLLVGTTGWYQAFLLPGQCVQNSWRIHPSDLHAVDQRQDASQAWQAKACIYGPAALKCLDACYVLRPRKVSEGHWRSIKTFKAGSHRMFPARSMCMRFGQLPCTRLDMASLLVAASWSFKRCNLFHFPALSCNMAAEPRPL